MLYVHLTVEDVLNTRFASQPAPLLEVALAMAMLQRRDPVFRGWQRSAAARLPRAAHPLFELIPPAANGPHFLDPVTTELPEALEQVQTAPACLVEEGLRRVVGAGAPAPWVRLLAARNAETWSELDLALRLAYRHLIEDSWPRLLTGFRSELAWRSRLIAELGVKAALSTLHPSLSWTGTTITVQADAELHLQPGGAGLTLMPSTLWTGRPLLGQLPDGSVLILYAALTPLPLIDGAGSDPLAGILGPTRAAILQLTLTEQTTTELSRQVGVSAATISGHTKALRAAGLIATIRAGKAVQHSVTPLGHRLLLQHLPIADPTSPSRTNCPDAG